MIEQPISEKVACCVAIGAQRATNGGFSAIAESNTGATSNLKILAINALQRNSLRNNQATSTLKYAQQIGEKNGDVVARSCAVFDGILDAKTTNAGEQSPNAFEPYGDWRRYCRQCLHHRPMSGRGAQVIRCTAKKTVNHDNIPRHCGEWKDNGLPAPTTGLFQRFNTGETPC